MKFQNSLIFQWPFSLMNEMKNVRSAPPMLRTKRYLTLPF